MPCSPLSVPRRSTTSRNSCSMAASTDASSLVVVPQEVDVQVAVAGVPVGERSGRRALAGARHPVEQLADLLARHHHVLAELVLGQLAAPRGSSRGAPPTSARAAPRPARPARRARPTSSQASEMRSACARTRVSSPSTSISSIAPARGSMRVARVAHRLQRARVEELDAARHEPGCHNRAHRARRSACTSSKSTISVMTLGGFGTSLSVMSPNTASVPSLPTRSAVRS